MPVFFYTYIHIQTVIIACIFVLIWTNITGYITWFICHVHISYFIPWNMTLYRHIWTLLYVYICTYMRLYEYIFPSISSSYVPVCLVLHVTYMHIQADMHSSGSSYLPVFACIVRNICTFSWSKPVFACMQTNICTVSGSMQPYTGTYEHIREFIFACIYLYCEKYMHIFIISACICLYS